MAAGLKERLLMLALGIYAQWRSRFMRYIDTKPNGEALKKCITEGPYEPSTVIIPAQPATDNSPAVAEQTVIEDLTNMSTANKAHYQAEKEAIHMLLTGIGDDIYSTVDACKTSHKMWIAIKRLQQESMESYYSRFYKMMNEMYKKEANEIRAEKIARNANLLVLVGATQQYPDPYYQAPKPQRSYAPVPKQYSSTRSNVSTRNKGKEIAKPITPPSKSAFEEDSDPEQAKKDKEMQKNLALIAKYFKKLYKPTNNNLKTSSNSRNKNVDTTLRYVNENQTGQFRNQRTVTVAGARETIGSQVVQQTGIQCYNYKEFGHFAKECMKPNRTKDCTYHKEKMLLYKQAEKGVPLQGEQVDWLEDMDEEVGEQ
ncbi:retrovirus-related pol polyprotein from transposon TNT 1-94 [Tanacetum coccineum]|uniref:Retrovirus-related pol polyprotein from transposon TNT 1-94 n=1 Tax=Tanacetum coccineum TaxID=301880 RepID=A0ABQ4XHF9_9ASTR